MLGKNKDKFSALEVAGQIKSMPMTMGDAIDSDVDDGKVIDNPEDFRAAIHHAQLSGKDAVEVSEELFFYLVKNNQTEYLTYGSPGVKVFKEGTKDKILQLEKLPPEEANKQRKFNK